MLKAIKSDVDKEGLSEKILNKIVAEKRAKVNLADDIINLSSFLSMIIKKIQISVQIKANEKP